MTRPVDHVCPVCDAQPLLPCVEGGLVLSTFHKQRGANPVMQAWRELSGAYEAAERARSTTRADETVAWDGVCGEDEAARGKA